MPDQDKLDQFKCFAINHYGDGMTPFATVQSLKYFVPSYIKICVERALKDKKQLTDEGVTLAKECLKGGKDE